MSDRRESAGRDASTSDIVRDETATYEPMAIVERYERVINYLYPILQSAPRKHGVARDEALKALFGQVDLFIQAGKSHQISRLYSADANLGVVRFWLRFMADPGRRIMTHHQHRTASVLLAEVGSMLGGWMRSMKNRGRSGS